MGEYDMSPISKYRRAALSLMARKKVQLRRNYLNCCSTVHIDPDDNMFIMDTNNHWILRWQFNAFHSRCHVDNSVPRENRKNKFAEINDVTFDCKGNMLAIDKRNIHVRYPDMFDN
jgi:sugar lactone lactonase YvrE